MSSIINIEFYLVRKLDGGNKDVTGNVVASLDKEAATFLDSISRRRKIMRKSLIISRHGDDIEKIEQLIAFLD